jgi:type II secretory pathway component HofQ
VEIAMKRVVLALLLASLVTPFAACRGRRITPAPEATVVATDLPAAAAAEGEGGDLLAEEAAAARIAAEEQEFLVRSHLTRAREAAKSGDFDSAREWYGRALDIDPKNAEAIEALRNLSDDRGGSVAGYLEEQRSLELVRRQEAAAEVKNYIERGRSLEASESYAEAVKEYQKALSIVSWYTDTSEFGVTADKVRDLIENAEYKAEVASRNARADQIRAAQAERENELAADRERRVHRIRSYFEQANLAFRRGEYELAREYAKAVVREDAQNCEAAQLIQISYDAEHSTNEIESRRQFDEQWRAVMTDLDHSTLPQVRTVVFPEDWLDGIAQRRPRVVGEADDAGDASSAAIYAALESKRVKGIAWEGANLDVVVGYLRTITGLNFFITPKVRTEKMEEVSITWSGDDITVRNLLDLVVTEPYELRWEVRNGVVTIAAADEVSGLMKLRYFDVKDLNVAIQNFVGQEINLVPSNFTPPEPPELPDPQPIFQAENLVELIKETIGKEGTWDEPAAIDTKNGIIIARNRPEILQQVEALLDDLRANSGLLVHLEVRFLTAEDNFLRDVGVDIGVPGLGTDAPQDDIFFGSAANPYGVPFGVFPEPSSAGTSNDSGMFYNDGQDGAYQARIENLFDVLLGNPEVLTGSGGLSFQHTFLDDTQIEVILRAVEKSERIQQITAPTITVYNTQRANVSVLNQLSYVQDYDVEIAQASNIANPIIQTIQDGIVLDVRPVVSADLRFVTLELRPTVALLTRPIATFSTSLASGPITASAPVIIQIPELRVSRVRTTVTMPDGGTLLLGGLKFYEQVTEESGIPFLSDIPILSFLCSRKGHYVNKRNLMILITAEIVPLEELEPRGNLELPPVPLGSWTPLRPVEGMEGSTVPDATCPR